MIGVISPRIIAIVDLGVLNSPLAKAMSYRSNELPPAQLPTLTTYTGRDNQPYSVINGYGSEFPDNMRGSKKDGDIYMVTSLKLTYIVGKTFIQSQERHYFSTSSHISIGFVKTSCCSSDEDLPKAAASSPPPSSLTKRSTFESHEWAKKNPPVLPLLPFPFHFMALNFVSSAGIDLVPLPVLNDASCWVTFTTNAYAVNLFSLS